MGPIAKAAAGIPLRVCPDLAAHGAESTSQLLNQAMRLLAAQPHSLFIGQGVAADGVATFDSFGGVPMAQRIEFPIAEDMNVGFATGLALLGYLPIVVIPRMDFLLRAADQIVSHLDKIEEMSRGQFKPKVIIRTRVGSRKPLDAGPQHSNNFSAAFRSMLTNITVSEILHHSQILPMYNDAIGSDRSTLIVENITG